MLQSIYLHNYNSTLKQTTEDSGNLYVTGELALTSVLWSFLIRATLSVACGSAAVTLTISAGRSHHLTHKAPEQIKSLFDSCN